MKDLKECREILNAIDPLIRELFIKRMEVVKEVALYKKANNMAIFDLQREKEMKERLTKEVDDELSPYYLAFLESMLEISKEYQNELI